MISSFHQISHLSKPSPPEVFRGRGFGELNILRNLENIKIPYDSHCEAVFAEVIPEPG
jgi:hypothetical protein